MSTSGSYDFTATRNDIIDRALRKIGILSASATQITDAAEELNSMVKDWQSGPDGVHLWALEDTSKTFSSEDASFTPETDTIGITSAFVRDDNDYDHKVTVISYQRYLEITDKTTTGRITHIAFNYGEGALAPVVYVWPTISSTYYAIDTLHYIKFRKLEDFDSSTDNPDLPESWISALVWGLAANLAPEFSIMLQDTQWLEQKASMAKLKAQAGNKEMVDSEFIESCYPKR